MSDPGPACWMLLLLLELLAPRAGGRSPKQEELLGSGEALDLENSCAG